MESYQIYKNLAWLNELSSRDAESVFLDCCGSSYWARRMAEQRPFPLLAALFDAAERTWFALSPADWLEAFAAHPQIGTNKKPPSQGSISAGWSQVEQSGMDATDGSIHEQMAEANRLYHEKFGFIFIVCATGKSADEMLAICRARYRNSTETELRLAAEEQRKITAIRLTKLLER
ncbi:MAG: 2-oxo-4-hydroxy-4-carboxy-5-ureidoimidazoline decarboxylase [Pyrinomonadaceae bacterium]